MVSFHSYVAVYHRVSIGVPTLPVVLHRCHVRWLRPIRGRSAWTGPVSRVEEMSWPSNHWIGHRVQKTMSFYHVLPWNNYDDHDDGFPKKQMMLEWVSSLSARRMLHSWRKCPASLHAKTFGHLHGCTSRERSCYHFVGSFLNHVLEVSLWTVLGLPCPLFAIVLRSCALSGDGGRPWMGGHIPDLSRFLDSRWCQLMSRLKNGWAKGHWPIIMLPL